MTKPFRIALKVWLCLIATGILDLLIDTTLEHALTHCLNLHRTIVNVSLVSLCCLGFLGCIIFWEKLTG